MDTCRIDESVLDTFEILGYRITLWYNKGRKTGTELVTFILKKCGLSKFQFILVNTIFGCSKDICDIIGRNLYRDKILIPVRVSIIKREVFYVIKMTLLKIFGR